MVKLTLCWLTIIRGALGEDRSKYSAVNLEHSHPYLPWDFFLRPQNNKEIPHASRTRKLLAVPVIDCILDQFSNKCSPKLCCCSVNVHIT
jgi:hypothetical protein